MDDGAPILEVGFAIDTHGAFAEVLRFQEMFDDKTVAIIRQVAEVERATGGMMKLGPATAQIASFGNASTRVEQNIRREKAQTEKSIKAMIRTLDREAAAVGKTRAEVRGAQIEELALAAARQNNTDAADRLAASARRLGLSQAALAEDQAGAAALAAAAIEREAQSLRDATLAYQMFEAAARRGIQAMREQQAAEAAAVAETEALAAAALRLRASLDPAFAAQQRFDREMRQAQQLIRANTITLDEYAAKLRMEQTILDESSAAHARGATSAGGLRMAMQGVSYQAQDTFTQISMGANPLAVLAIQGGQAAGQLAHLEGKLGAVARFMLTPWGLAITAGLLVLGALTKGLFDNDEASKAAEEGLKKFQERQSDIGNFIDATTGKLIEQNRTLVLNATLSRQAQIRDNEKAITEGRNAALSAARAARFTNASDDDLYAAQRGGSPARAGMDADVARSIRAAGGDVDKLATSIANLATTRRPDLKPLALEMSNQAGQAILAQRENAKLATELRALAGDTTALAHGTTGLIEKQVALATATTPLTRARAQLALVQERATAADKAGGAALVRYRADLTAATIAVNAAEAAQKAASEAKKDAVKLDREAVKFAEARRDFDADTDGLQQQLALVRQGVEASEARFRVEQARAGITQEAIERRLAAEQRLSVELQAQADFAAHLAGYAPAIDVDARAKVDMANFTKSAKAQGDFNEELRLTAERAREVADLMSHAFGRVGDAIGDAVAILGEYGARQDEISKNVVKGNLTIEQGAQRSADLQMNSLIGLTGAAKGLFHEHSKGAEAAAAAEKALTVIQLARTAVAVADGAANMFASLGPLGFPAVAAMLAVMASLGFHGGGSAGSYKPASNTGIGTTFGDSDAQSASIAKSLEHIDQASTESSRYGSQMAASLHNIETNISGLTNLIIRGGGLGAASARVNTGTSNPVNNTVAGGLMFGALGAVFGNELRKVPLLGDVMGVVSSLGKALFGTKTSITSQGITGGPQSLSDILGTGFDASYFTEVQKKKKFLGVTSSTKYSTLTSDADGEIEQQFGLILKSFSDAIGAAAVPLGLSLDDVKGKLAGFVVDIGRIDFKGLTGEEIQDRLAAVFGAAGDKMAQAAFAGLAPFQKVGEGYFETMVRVASSVEGMNDTFRLLGQRADYGVANTMALVDAFGDVSDALSATSEYFKSFYTDAERSAATAAQLRSVIEGLGLAMPGSTAAFRALVEAQDLTSEAGRQAYVTLLKLAPAFADTFGSAQDATEAATNAAKAANELRDAWKSVGDSIMDEVRRIRGLSDASGGNTFASLQGQFNAATSAARGGDMDASKALPQLSQALLSAAADAARSRQELDRVRAATAASLETTYGLIGSLSGSAATLANASNLNSGSTAQTAAASANDNLVASLSDRMDELIEEIAQLRSDNNSGHAATAGNTGRAARVLENVSGASGGDAINVANVA